MGQTERRLRELEDADLKQRLELFELDIEGQSLDVEGSKLRQQELEVQGDLKKCVDAIAVAGQAPADQAPDRKGDITLLNGKTAVNFKEAEQYLGITPRGRQKAMPKLVVVGEGKNRRITVQSLLSYLPPK